MYFALFFVYTRYSAFSYNFWSFTLKYFRHLRKAAFLSPKQNYLSEQNQAYPMLHDLLYSLRDNRRR